MDNQMIIILAILLLFFMKNKKENWGIPGDYKQRTSTPSSGWSS